MFKFGMLRGAEDVEYRYDDVYSVENYPTWSRLVIGARENQIPVMLDIARTWPGPYGILYVLLVSRLGREPGRYQILQPCDWDALELFAYTFQEYFEKDGRHHLWLIDVLTNSQLVYDNHNVIYAYGDQERVEATLRKRGFHEGSTRFPCPHTHHYNKEFDQSEDEIMRRWKWKPFPLQAQDRP